MKQMFDYVKERYPEYSDESVVFAYLTYLNKEQFKIFKVKEGFFTYKFQGDACIVNDVYVTPKYRKTKASKKLFANLLKITLKNKDCRVLIGFSEFAGENQVNGKGAMLSLGFVKIGEDNCGEIYLRGNY